MGFWEDIFGYTDGKGITRMVGEPFYDGAGIMRCPGDPFVDGAGVLVYPGQDYTGFDGGSC